MAVSPARNDGTCESDADRTGMSPGLLAALAAHPREMATTIAALHRRVTDHDGLLHLMQLVAVEAVRRVDGVRWAGVTAQFDSVPFTIAHSHARVLILDEDQYRTQDGPCLRALRIAEPVFMTLSEIRTAWPRLGDAARDNGVLSVLAVPIIARGVSVAVLNLYSDTTDALLDVDADVVLVLTEYLRRATLDFVAGQPWDNAGVRLRQALYVRSVIDQATGVLMARHVLDHVDAVSVLHAQAHRRGRSPEHHSALLIADHRRPHTH